MDEFSRGFLAAQTQAADLASTTARLYSAYAERTDDNRRAMRFWRDAETLKELEKCIRLMEEMRDERSP